MKVPNNAEALLKTNIGSHMWGMAHANSDLDTLTIVVQPTEDLLRGRPLWRSRFDPGEEDAHYHEVQKAVHQLLKGNMNFVQGVLSPIVMEDSFYGKRLRTITKDNLAKNIYGSIEGMSRHNAQKYFNESSAAYDPSPRRCAKILRALEWGIRILDGEGSKFQPPTIFPHTPQGVEEARQELKVTLKSSHLPERPDREPFEQFLMDLRTEQLHESGT